MGLTAPHRTRWTSWKYFRFVFPSLIGVFLFLCPVKYGSELTIPVGILANELRWAIGEFMATFTTCIFVSGAIFTVLFNLRSTQLNSRFPQLHALFATNWTWFALRILGGLLALLTFLELGPEWIIGAKTGRTAYIDIAGIIFCILGVASLLLPLLTDFGFLEFVGAIMRGVFQATFNLPGRATVDTLASWVGASSVAVLVTIRQYQAGFYSVREACVIATNFSVVSIPFVVLTAQIAGIGDLFMALYGSMVGIGIVCAIVTPRLPPLSRLTDRYYQPIGRQIHEEAAADTPRLRWAMNQAVSRATTAPGPGQMVKGVLSGTADLFFTMMPASMTIEFICLVTYHYTPVFQYVTLPLVPVLNLLQIPEAAAASPGLVVGLLDQFVPALIAASIDDKVTSFVLAGLSVTQLIFFAETGVLILRSVIPLNILQLIGIFFLRTVIALPILALVAHLVV